MTGVTVQVVCALIPSLSAISLIAASNAGSRLLLSESPSSYLLSLNNLNLQAVRSKYATCPVQPGSRKASKKFLRFNFKQFENDIGIAFKTHYELFLVGKVHGSRSGSHIC